MARKRNSRERSSPTITTKYNFDETFDNSEDEFFAERDKILLEDGPVAKRQRKIEGKLVTLRVRLTNFL